ncbi:hypothetical protein ACFWPX_24045 [Nocardia sp. NPDC058518]|uniref:hypothetical protein n=1 Tax=Nocardia sp. NPDC058518 TaxID=3346534 RepID=UPI0036654650
MIRPLLGHANEAALRCRDATAGRQVGQKVQRMADVDPVSGHIEQLQRALTDARGRAVSADGSLRLEAGANGTIHSIELGDSGADLGAAAVVSLILELHREAVAEAAATMRAAVAALSSDPRLHEDRQEVVGKLARPRPESEYVAAPQHYSPHQSSTTREANGAPRVRNSSPSGELQRRPTPHKEPERARSAPLPTPPQKPAAPPKLSAFDPVTFAPLPRANRPVPPNQRSIAPDLSGTSSGASPEKPITHDARDVGSDAEPASRPLSIELAATETDFVPADPFASWGEPGDGTGIAPGSWLPDDNLMLSDDWWEWRR